MCFGRVKFGMELTVTFSCWVSPCQLGIRRGSLSPPIPACQAWAPTWRIVVLANTFLLWKLTSSRKISILRQSLLRRPCRDCRTPLAALQSFLLWRSHEGGFLSYIDNKKKLPLHCWSEFIPAPNAQMAPVLCRFSSATQFWLETLGGVSIHQPKNHPSTVGDRPVAFGNPGHAAPTRAEFPGLYCSAVALR